MPAHLSYSQIALYLECPLLYKLRYIDGERGEATPAALAFGKAIHQTLTRYYTQAKGVPICFCWPWKRRLSFGWSIRAPARNHPCRCCLSTRFGRVHEACMPANSRIILARQDR